MLTGDVLPDPTVALVRNALPSDGPDITGRAYGAWFRDGLRFDRFGRPSWVTPHFTHMLRGYSAIGKVVRATNAPDMCQDWINQAFPSTLEAVKA